MKGSLWGAGRPLAKDKTSICPPSLAQGGGLPPGWPAGEGGGHRCALFPLPIFPISLTEGPLQLPRHPLPVWPPTQGIHGFWASPAVGREAVSSLALEAYKQLQEGGSGMTGRGLAWKEASTPGPLCEAATWRGRPALWMGC